MKHSILARMLALAFPLSFLRLNVDPPAPAAPAPSPTPAPPEPETFSKEYVRELRGENKGWRLKASELEAARDKAIADAKKATEDAAATVAAANTESQQRLIRAELKAAALKAGMVDLDGLKLADLSTVKLNDAGEVEGAEALFEAMKKAKPYLFGNPGHSSTPGTPPSNTPPAAKHAREMTPEEYAAARAKLATT